MSTPKKSSKITSSDSPIPTMPASPTKTTNGSRIQSTAISSKPTPSSSSASKSTSMEPARRVIVSFIVIILALFLAQATIPSLFPFNLFKPFFNEYSYSASNTAFSSPTTQPSHSRRDDGSPQFGTPMTEAIPSSAPMYARYQEYQEREQKQQQRQQQRQSRREQHFSPFDSFFGSNSDPEDDEGTANDVSGEGN
ncbi:hypothetical protein FBU30_000014 [Linnemannia zychae]|nr:hypothetical protein FBU30_000014 [Linnemannia zychae]